MRARCVLGLCAVRTSQEIRQILETLLLLAVGQIATRYTRICGQVLFDVLLFFVVISNDVAQLTTRRKRCGSVQSRLRL